MHRTKPMHIVLSIIVFTTIFISGKAFSIEAYNEDDTTLNVNGRMQLHGVLERLEDDQSDSERLFLFLRQSRLSINGESKGVDYEVEWMLGGEEVPENNSVMSLLDAYIDVPFVEDTFEVKGGQFKVPYGRERLRESGDFYFTDRSIHNNFFNIGRDVGAAAHTEKGDFTGALGLFTGGGINIPERYLPEDLDFPMFVARVGLNHGLDKNVFTPYNFNQDSGRLEGRGEVKYAAYLNGMYTKDSRVGHSTPLNVKYYDKSLMLVEDWNPYIGARGAKARYSQYGADAAIQIPTIRDCDLLLSSEFNVSGFSNHAGSLNNVGGVAKANLLMDEWVFGLRYAIVDPDSDMAYTEKNEDTGETERYSITDKNIKEIAGSAVYFVKEFNLKFIADLSYQMDVPVGIEKGLGGYNLMRQPEQVGKAANGGIELQDNYLASLIIQYEF